MNIDRERLVLGTAGLAGLWGKIDEDESVKTILYALEQGITHFDAAPAYADAERILQGPSVNGKALNLLSVQRLEN